jgi:tyrosinase
MLNIQFDKCIGTSRYGIFDKQPPEVWVEGIENNDRITTSLEHPDWEGEASGSIANNVYRLLSESYFKSYEPFSSTIYQKQYSVTEYLSLEMIHNNIHVKLS